MWEKNAMGTGRNGYEQEIFDTEQTSIKQITGIPNGKKYEQEGFSKFRPNKHTPPKSDNSTSQNNPSKSPQTYQFNFVVMKFSELNLANLE